MNRPSSYYYRNIWESHHGKIPVGHHIHHIDGNPWNNDISNLQCVTPEEHYLIHKRQGDKWEAMTLLRQMGKFTDESDFCAHGDKVLWEMTNYNFIRIPYHARANGIVAPETKLMNDMDHFEDIGEVYDDSINDILTDIMYKCLTDKERNIIRWSFGMDDDKLTSREIGQKINMSDRAVRKAKSRALKKLSNYESHIRQILSK